MTGFMCLHKHSLRWGSNTGLSSFWTFLELNKFMQSWDYYISNPQSISIHQGAHQHNGTPHPKCPQLTSLLLLRIFQFLLCSDLLREELVSSRLFLSPPSRHSNIPLDVPPSFNSLFTTAFHLPHVNISRHHHQLDFMMGSNHFL